MRSDILRDDGACPNEGGGADLYASDNQGSRTERCAAPDKDLEKSPVLG